MQIVIVIALLGAAFVYLLILSIVPPSAKEEVDGRIAKYFYTEDINGIEDKVFKDKREKYKKKKGSGSRFVSKELTDYLAASGINLSASEFIYAWLGATFIPALLIMLFSGNIVTAIGIAIIGFIIPPILVQRARKKRQELFNKQLGESLVIMSNCVKAGFTFAQAMESIAKDMQPPISLEFANALREVRFGASQNDALRHMVERVKNKDLDLLVSAVLTSAQVGGNLSDILDVIAATVQDRIKIKQQVRVLTSQGRISGKVIGLLPVIIILMLMLINPGYFSSFFETSIGKIMLGVSVIMECIGFFVISKIVNIEY